MAKHNEYHLIQRSMKIVFDVEINTKKKQQNLMLKNKTQKCYAKSY